MSAVRAQEGMQRILDVALSDLASSLLLGLFMAPTVPVATNVFADFVQPTFPGYTSASPVFAGSSTIDGNGNAANAMTTPIIFTQSSSASPQVVYGWVLWDSGTSKVIDSELFPSGPLTFTNPGDAVSVTVTEYQGQIPPPF